MSTEGKSTKSREDWLVERVTQLEEALLPFGIYARAREAQPLVGLGDEIHRIHTGSEHEAVIQLSDCSRAADVLGLPRSRRA